MDIYNLSFYWTSILWISLGTILGFALGKTVSWHTNTTLYELIILGLVGLPCIVGITKYYLWISAMHPTNFLIDLKGVLAILSFLIFFTPMYFLAIRLGE